MFDQSQIAGSVAGTERVNQPNFIGDVQARLGNIRENLNRAGHILAEAGFYADPSPAPDAPQVPADTKRNQVIDDLRVLENMAIGLVQQIVKVA